MFGSLSSFRNWDWYCWLPLGVWAVSWSIHCSSSGALNDWIQNSLRQTGTGPEEDFEQGFLQLSYELVLISELLRDGNWHQLPREVPAHLPSLHQHLWDTCPVADHGEHQQPALWLWGLVGDFHHSPLEEITLVWIHMCIYLHRTFGKDLTPILGHSCQSSNRKSCSAL